MEKKLIKGALYGFIIGLGIAILYYPQIRRAFRNKAGVCYWDYREKLTTI